MLRWAFCLLKHFYDRSGTALADTAQALLIQSGKTASLIAWCRLSGTAILTCCLQMFFIIFAYFDDLVMDFRSCRTLCQQMLTANPLNRLTHDGGSTKIYQKVAQFSYCRVGSDSGGCIRTAALDSHKQFGNVTLLFLDKRCLCSYISCSTHCFFNGL